MKEGSAKKEIRLKAVTLDNLGEISKLSVSAEQTGYIETIPACLKEAEELSLWRPVGIYDGALPVGFAMYGEFKEEGENGRVWLDRFLIDQRYQGQGYGARALKALLKRLFCEYSCGEIYLSLYEENKEAESLYKNHGFAYTGERDEHGELIMELTRERWIGVMSEQKNREEDWELSEDYYKNEDGRELKLEDFVTEGMQSPEAQSLGNQSPEAQSQSGDLLAKTVEEVRTVLSLAAGGLTIEEISARTGFDRQYVYNIQVCAQGFREDDEIAVAHLVLMG